MRHIQDIKECHSEMSNKLLFRGHGNSNWKVDTTMERNLKTPISMLDYYKFAYRAQFKLGEYIHPCWKICTVEEFTEWLENNIGKSSFYYVDLPSYEYLAYLRHHTFPSPLLDWTSSLYVALYFAFSECIPESKKCVSIYCYLECPYKYKSRSPAKPVIHKFGPYAKIHTRHVKQQSQYSICVQYDTSQESIMFSNHEKVFEANRTDQDLLWKFNLPSSLRHEVLIYLQEMNINSYTLFGSEDSLVNSIATNEIIEFDL